MNAVKAIEKIKGTVIKDILEGKYHLVKKDEYYGYLKYKDSEVTVWITSGWDYIHVMIGDIKIENLTKEEKVAIYKLARTRGIHMAKAELKEYRVKRKEALELHRESLEKIKKLKLEIKEFTKQE